MNYSSEDQVNHITCQYDTPLGSFQIEIRPFSRKQFEQIGKKHRKPITSKRNRSITEYETNLETYYPDLYSRVVKGWTGLTQDVKRVLCHEVINGQPDNSEVPFNLELLVKMCRTSVQFAEFIDDAAMNFDTLYAEDIRIKREILEQERLDIETKN